MWKQAYNFNLLVSCRWRGYKGAREEITQILKALGDESPHIKLTLARGMIGVKTHLDSRRVINGLRSLLDQNPLILQHTLKWAPIDLWTPSDMNSMKEGVTELRDKIHAGERWRMTVEKRLYTRHHKIEIIEELAELIDKKVDLENPDKILLIEILGGHAGISLLEPQDILSAVKTSPAIKGSKP